MIDLKFIDLFYCPAEASIISPVKFSSSIIVLFISRISIWFKFLISCCLLRFLYKFNLYDQFFFPIEPLNT